MDLGQRPHTLRVKIEDITFADKVMIQGMHDKELYEFLLLMGLQVRPEWDREHLMRALMSAMYEASAARV